MTYGQIRLRLTQTFPDVSLELLEGWIQDRYTAILDSLSWTRIKVAAVLQTTAPYRVGTVALTAGSNVVTGTGTAWTAAMSGRAFTVPGRNESYTFTRASDATGTLDRPYEGSSAVSSAYVIVQHVYTLPAACRLLEDSAFDGLERLGRAAVRQGGLSLGTPRLWASYPDDGNPPLMRVELAPVPDKAIGLPYEYVTEQADLAGATTSLLPWVRPAALIAGVSADASLKLKDFGSATAYETLYEKRLSEMRGIEAQRSEPFRMQLDSYYTDHRVRRYQR